MADKLAEGSDVVVASRYVPGGKEIGLAPHRRLFSRLCSLWLKAVFGIRGLSDYTCGYRLYRASALKILQSETKGRFFEEDGFACSSELVLNLARTGARFAEVPLVLRYDLKQGKSKMPVLRTIGGYFGLVRRMRLGV
jgi:dolichol-phosphate mannosyltransferase